MYMHVLVWVQEHVLIQTCMCEQVHAYDVGVYMGNVCAHVYDVHVYV